MADFNSSIFDNSRERVLLCAHRGVSGADIPCNSLAAFKAALMSGADMIELDVTKSIDGKFFVFHPGMERPHLRSRKFISAMRSDKVGKLRFVNQDDCKTDFRVNTLEEVLDFLRGKCYINVDKYWSDIPGITGIIR
ncbi:MAG: glycerophosphodiester phosphodiesterase family protein, partial [Clostridia bacterium]|nr:glycerophosphodiester phosphodiesterase family protein [Clostridia bacterium]